MPARQAPCQWLSLWPSLPHFTDRDNRILPFLGGQGLVETGSHYVDQHSNAQRSAYLCPPSVETKDVCHHALALQQKLKSVGPELKVSWLILPLCQLHGLGKFSDLSPSVRLSTCQPAKGGFGLSGVEPE